MNPPQVYYILKKSGIPKERMLKKRYIDSRFRMTDLNKDLCKSL